MTKMKIIAAATVGILVAATPIALQYRANVKLREENRALRAQATGTRESEAVRTENQRAASPTTGTNQDQFRELMRLRGEVNLLRKQMADLANNRRVQEQRSEDATPAEAEPPGAEEEKQMAVRKMNDTGNWLRAFVLFAGKNDDKMPSGFSQASAFVPEQMRAQLNQTAEQFDIIVYPGTLAEMTKPPPEKTILLREKQAWQSVNVMWAKTYGFADGHSEVHFSPDGNFDAWESERLQRTGQ